MSNTNKSARKGAFLCAKYRIRSYAKPAAANPVLCAEHIAFPLGKVARCGAARTVTDEGRPPAAGVTAAERTAAMAGVLGSPVQGELARLRRD